MCAGIRTYVLFVRTGGVRETLEEAGVAIEMKALLRLEHQPRRSATRLRAIFYAEPVSNSGDGGGAGETDCAGADAACRAKTIPDFESAGAAWMSVDEMEGSGVRWRNEEPLYWCKAVADGTTAMHSLELLVEF